MAKLQQTTSLPTNIRVGSFDIKIKLQHNLTNMSGDEGSYIESEQTILLDKSLIELKNSYSLALIWHEICHAIFSQYSLSGQVEEITVNSFSQGIVQVLRDNPEFNKWSKECIT